MRFFWKITILGILLLLILLFWAFFIGFSSDRHGSSFNKGNNAVWAAHKWVEGNVSDAEIADLIKSFNAHEIKTVFVHSGPILFDGTIDQTTYGFAFDFLEKAKKLAPDIEFQAWLGQIRSNIDLADPHVRRNILKEVQILLGISGFDGIHYDIEPVWDGDLDFIKLLAETREILPEDKKISVALAEFIPGKLVWLLKPVHEFKNYNTELNYRNVAKYADQIVVMVYDTSFKSDFWYRFLVREQTIWTTSLLKGKDVFIGIPAYKKPTPYFNPEVENMENGLLGLVDGLNNTRSKEASFAGVAIYPNWEISEADWEIYRNLWLD